jgi:hypothetical protein
MNNNELLLLCKQASAGSTLLLLEPSAFALGVGATPTDEVAVDAGPETAMRSAIWAPVRFATLITVSS